MTINNEDANFILRNMEPEEIKETKQEVITIKEIQTMGRAYHLRSLLKKEYNEKVKPYEKIIKETGNKLKQAYAENETQKWMTNYGKITLTNKELMNQEININDFIKFCKDNHIPEEKYKKVIKTNFKISQKITFSKKKKI